MPYDFHEKIGALTLACSQANRAFPAVAALSQQPSLGSAYAHTNERCMDQKEEPAVRFVMASAPTQMASPRKISERTLHEKESTLDPSNDPIPHLVRAEIRCLFPPSDFTLKKKKKAHEKESTLDSQVMFQIVRCFANKLETAHKFNDTAVSPRKFALTNFLFQTTLRILLWGKMKSEF